MDIDRVAVMRQYRAEEDGAEPWDADATVDVAGGSARLEQCDFTDFPRRN